MSELGKAYVQIVPSAKGISGSISKALSGESDKAGKSSGKSIVNRIKGMLAKAAIGATIGAGIKKAVGEGAELQQNLGGTEAVFGKFAGNIQKTATDAYKNMGLSASDYMATANKMGSLFQGSGVDQQRSLDLTSKAMQRAADVASVMGVDTSMAMESIAGAAKGNFTMMDNLGVKMDATTLQAYALEKGMNFEWKTASNAEKAELAMKMFFDRTKQYEENFARESNETISGSLGAMSAAFSDFMGRLALGDDIKGPLTNLISTTGTFLFDNLVPTIGNVVKALPEVIGTVLKESGPSIASRGRDLLNSLGNGIVSNLPSVVARGREIIANLATGLIENLPAFLDSASQMLASFGQYIWDNLPAIAEEGGRLVGQIGAAIIDNLPEIGAAAGKLLTTLYEGLMAAVPMLLRAGASLIKGLASGLGGTALNLIKGAISKVVNAISKPIDKVKDVISKAMDKIKSIVNGLKLELPHFKLPHFSISGGQAPWGLGGKGTKPSIGVSWYKKAEDQPYMFDRATLFGAGERNDEILYGKGALMRDIRTAVAANGGNTFNITLNADGTENPEQYAQRFARELRRQVRMGAV